MQPSFHLFLKGKTITADSFFVGREIMSSVPPPPFFGDKKPELGISDDALPSEPTQPVLTVDTVIVSKNIEPSKLAGSPDVGVDEPVEKAEKELEEPVVVVKEASSWKMNVLRFTLAALLLVGSCVLGYLALATFL